MTQAIGSPHVTDVLISGAGAAGLTLAIELARRRPDAICVALHPGTVATPLSEPFGKAGLDVVTPEIAAARLLRVIDRLEPADSGGFFDYRGEPLPW